ncbi:MAG: GTPase HflX [Nitrospirota bacterium]|nr:GTPase HflX [Nitrospirota bacterium]MDP2381408.1 GTPase HflX [Nitrospirota bacterium]MDP3598870.1 GTPase HflX [Nitrospirota bacterium]
MLTPQWFHHWRTRSKSIEKDTTLIPEIYGQVLGLRAGQLAMLERLYRRRMPVDDVLSSEAAKILAQFTHEIRRPIGLVITRRGAVQDVLVGAGTEPSPTTLTTFRASPQSLRGLRLIRSSVKEEPITQEDLSMLGLLRLDMIGTLAVTPKGEPGLLSLAHLNPPGPEKSLYTLLKPTLVHQCPVSFETFIHDLESDLQRQGASHTMAQGQTAILVSASPKSKAEQEERLAELAELASSADLTVIDRLVQRTQGGHHRFQLGSGKLKDVLTQAMQQGADLLIFDQDLAPGQLRAIAEISDLPVIDRTQLILDIFAQRAHSREGKVQVELAQLRYMLPRLSGQGISLSRLGGGIGSRGPGETKLETDRRRIRERIDYLEKEIEGFARHQDQRRSRRVRQDFPVLSIVGYTNAGKSTLLNVLTRSQVSAAPRVFETLDTTSRRLRFPHGREVIITDTVGFIRDLPKDLLAAFRTTLDELRDADLLLHVVDAGTKDLDAHIAAVDTVLNSLTLDEIPQILVFNKCDQLPPGQAEVLCQRYGAIGVSALHSETLRPLIRLLEERVAVLVPEEGFSRKSTPPIPLASQS